MKSPMINIIQYTYNTLIGKCVDLMTLPQNVFLTISIQIYIYGYGNLAELFIVILLVMQSRYVNI